MISIRKNYKKKKIKKEYTATFALNGCPQKRGVVKKVAIYSPRKPNSAKRRIAKVRLSNNRNILAKVMGQGHNLQNFSNVLVCGGRANDVPGVRYLLMKGRLDFAWKEEFRRVRRRSKYGIPVKD